MARGLTKVPKIGKQPAESFNVLIYLFSIYIYMYIYYIYVYMYYILYIYYIYNIQKICCPRHTVTFRPRSTNVAGTASNAEGFACGCRAANEEDGYRVGTGQEFKLTAVDVGNLVCSAT